MLPISEDELATRLDRSVSYLEVGLQCGGFTTGFTTDGGYSSVFVFSPIFSVITLNCNSVSIADASSIINLSFVVLIIIIFFILLK